MFLQTTTRTRTRIHFRGIISTTSTFRRAIPTSTFTSRPTIRNMSDQQQGNSLESQKTSGTFERYMDRWEHQWQVGNIDWDLGQRHPELYRLHQDRSSALYKDSSLPSSLSSSSSSFRKALVPGCGTGYDVFSMCEIPGIETVVGLDLAPTAVEKANELKATMGAPYDSLAQFHVANFFEFESSAERQQPSFDLCFDYTFLCAMDPADRETWAQTYARLMVKGGRLITIIFPLRKKPGHELTGPPFQISFDLTKQLLEQVGFQCVYHNVPEQSPEMRTGNEYVAIWEKK